MERVTRILNIISRLPDKGVQNRRKIVTRMARDVRRNLAAIRNAAMFRDKDNNLVLPNGYKDPDLSTVAWVAEMKRLDDEKKRRDGAKRKKP